MKYYFHIIFFLFFTISIQGQTNPIRKGIDRNDPSYQNQQDSTAFKDEQKITLSGKTHFTDYKIISHNNDTTFIDTTLTIKKYYKFNFLQKDNFELLPFHNQGQAFNNLGYTFDKVSLFPQMGARAKHYNYYEVEDIKYYHVPTPTTILTYRTGLEQGQVLNSLFTFNTSKRHNFSIAYKGIRSLGKYLSSLSSHGNLRATFSYTTKNNAYTLKSHIAAQDLTNYENGGLTPESIIAFENKDPNFTDRGRLTVNFTDAFNILKTNRYYLNHDYKIWQRRDSLNQTKNYLKVGHIFTYDLKHFEYSQTKASTAFFGDTFNSKIDDRLTYTTTNNQLFAALKAPIVLGEIKFNVDYLKYDYSYNSTININNSQVPSRINDDIISVGGTWETTFKKFNINAKAATIISGKFNGNYLKASASFKQDSLFNLKATFLTNSKSPNLNFLLNQSSYVQYNWYTDLKNERTRSLLFDFKSDKFLNASAQITQIDNYTYFNNTNNDFKLPIHEQYNKTVNYLKIKVNKEFNIGKFFLDNTLLYQKVAQGSSIFNVPELITRNSLYFSDYIFKGDPLYLQTGITFKYFSSYYANNYNPLLAEFTVQNKQLIGGYPIFDFFINAQIQRTRLYFKAEHFNSNFSKANYYVAPNYPYRDFVIRFGLVWNFFI